MSAATSGSRRAAPRRRFGFLLAIAVVGSVAGAMWSGQRREAARLREQTEQARVEVRELERLRAENNRLRAEQVPAAELERLRADHAALPRLRADVEAAARAGR